MFDVGNSDEIRLHMTSTQGGPRFVVVGTTGCGKSVLAQQLSRLYGVPHVELDAFNWEPNWTTASTDLFRQRVEQALRGSGWVVDGNYSEVRDLVWPRGTTLVWLDYPLGIIMWRTFRRIVSREELWNGNRERLRNQLFSRDSLFLYAVRSHRKRRKTYPLFLQQPEHAHLSAVRLRSPQETRGWFSSLRPREMG